jgi:hypothetical protein
MNRIWKRGVRRSSCYNVATIRERLIGMYPGSLLNDNNNQIGVGTRRVMSQPVSGS